MIHAPRTRGRASRVTVVLLSAIGLLVFGWPLLSGFGPFYEGAPLPVVTLIAPLLVAGVLLSLESSLADTRVLALVGVLAALAAAARLVSLGAGGVEFVFVVVILSGRVLGARLGFVVGVVAIGLSSVVWGGFGPWTAFQMLALGWVGAGAGLLPRVKPPSGGAAGKRELVMLMVYGAVASYVFGLLMNLWFWPIALGPDTSLSLVEGGSFAENASRFVLYSLASSTLTWDTVRAVTTVMSLVIIGRPALKALRRVYSRPQSHRKVLRLRVMEHESVR